VFVQVRSFIEPDVLKTM